MTQPSFNENWSISFKIVVPIFVALLSATTWLTSQLWRIEARQSISWTLHDQREWVKEFQTSNTNLFVPNPNDIFWQNRRRSLMDGVPVGGLVAGPQP